MFRVVGKKNWIAMFQNSVDVVIAVFKAFLKKIKKRKHSTLRQTCLEKYQFFVLRHFFLTCFVFFAVDFM